MSYDDILKAAEKACNKRSTLMTLGIAGAGITILLLCIIAFVRYNVSNIPFDKIRTFSFWSVLFSGLGTMIAFAYAGVGPKDYSSAEAIIWYLKREIARKIAIHLNKLQTIIQNTTDEINREQLVLNQMQNTKEKLDALPQSPSIQDLQNIAQKEIAFSEKTIAEFRGRLKNCSNMTNELIAWGKQWRELIEGLSSRLAFIGQAPSHFNTTGLKAEIAEELRLLFEHWSWQEKVSTNTLLARV